MSPGTALPAMTGLSSDDTDDAIRRLLGLPPKNLSPVPNPPANVPFVSNLPNFNNRGPPALGQLHLTRDGDSILLNCDPRGVIPPLRVIHKNENSPTADKLLMMLMGKLSPMSHRIGTPPTDVDSACEFNYDDEESSFAMNDEIFYRKDEEMRRHEPRYLEESKNLYDLNIVMPFSIPSGLVAVDVNTGDHFYAFRPILEGQLGPTLPEGTSTSYHPHPAQLLFGRGVSAMHTGGRRRGGGSRQFPSDSKATDLTTSGGPSACDTWASFLNVRLGTIFNVADSQMKIVCDLFKKCFEGSLCNFFVPISMECRGVFPSPDDSVSLQHQRQSLGGGPKVGGEKYETRGTLLTPNDQKRFRMIRRHLKKFAFELAGHFGTRDNKISPNFRLAQNPHICVELHENCKTEKTDSGIRVMIREWTKLADPTVLRKVWRAMGSSGVGLTNETSREAYGVVQMGELRLEHTHLRMVDPRWPNELVVGRRLADHDPESDLPGPTETQARFVFCTRLDPVNVVYLNHFHDAPSPKPSGKWQLSTVPWDELNSSASQSSSFRKLLMSGPFSSIVLDHLRNVPDAGLSRSPLLSTPTTADADDDPSELPPPLQKFLATVAAPTPPPCKFYLRGFCIRGAGCFFLHPVDRALESRADIREIPRNHPKFYN